MKVPDLGNLTVKSTAGVDPIKTKQLQGEANDSIGKEKNATTKFTTSGGVSGCGPFGGHNTAKK